MKEGSQLGLENYNVIVIYSLHEPGLAGIGVIEMVVSMPQMAKQTKHPIQTLILDSIVVSYAIKCDTPKASSFFTLFFSIVMQMTFCNVYFFHTLRDEIPLSDVCL